MNRHLQGFIASIVIVAICVISAIVAFALGAWYAAIAPIVIGVLVGVFLARPCWAKHREEDDSNETSSLFMKKWKENYPTLKSNLEMTFNSFKADCQAFIDKTLLLISKSNCSFKDNNKAVCDLFIFIYFNTRYLLCRVTRNANFIGQYDLVHEDILHAVLSDIFSIPNTKDFLNERLYCYDDIIQQSQDKDGDLINAVNQFITKDINNVESQPVFIGGIDKVIGLQLEVSNLYKHILENTQKEFEQVKYYSTVYGKATW